jgi:hypothetical protein
LKILAEQYFTTSLVSNGGGPSEDILDWFHFIENLHKVGGPLKRLQQEESLLWEGQVDKTIGLFAPGLSPFPNLLANPSSPHSQLSVLPNGGIAH